MHLHQSTRRALTTGALVIFSVVFPDCRNNDASTTPSRAIGFSFSFVAGDRFRYDLYDIDRYGFVVASSKRPVWWRVAQTGASLHGAPAVTVIVDSGLAASPDTVLLRMDAAGDLYRYGFLSEIRMLQGHPGLSETWDRVGAFSLGPATPWRVATIDGVLPIDAEIRSEQEYFTVLVNGQSTIFPAYRVDFTGATIDATCWFAERPPSIPGTVVSFFQDTTGRSCVLREIIRTEP